MRMLKVICAFIAVTLMLLGLPFASMAVQDETTGLSANYQVAPGKDTAAGITVENRDTKPHKYGLQAADLPEGFKAHFLSDGRIAGTIELRPSEKRIVELVLQPPSKITADSGTFKIKLSREDGTESFLPASFSVNRDYAVEITSGIKKLESMNGKSTGLDIAVTNTGSRELKNLGLKVDLPYKWSLENVVPDKVTLKPGENALFKLKISVPATQTSGNFVIKIKSLNSDTESSEISIPITVTASAGYAWWVIVLVLAVLAVTVLYFRKHGRR